MNNNTVFLVDDDDAVRHALRLYLECNNFVVREFECAQAMLDQVRAEDVGVLVSDLRMSGISGLDLQAELVARGIDLPIIFITGHGSIKDSVRAMKAGATDFIEKPFENEVLLGSIEQVLARRGKGDRRKLPRSELKIRYSSLTPREQEVMHYVVDGVSNRQMANKLQVSDRTIEVHRSRVMHKMGAENLPELVRMSMALGLGGLH